MKAQEDFDRKKQSMRNHNQMNKSESKMGDETPMEESSGVTIDKPQDEIQPSIEVSEKVDKKNKDKSITSQNNSKPIDKSEYEDDEYYDEESYDE